MGNPRLRNGPALDIADDDENTQAVLDRKPVAGPDEGVVRRETGTPEFRLAALARLVEYTGPLRYLAGFPRTSLRAGSCWTRSGRPRWTTGKRE